MLPHDIRSRRKEQVRRIKDHIETTRDFLMLDEHGLYTNPVRVRHVDVTSKTFGTAECYYYHVVYEHLNHTSFRGLEQYDRMRGEDFLDRSIPARGLFTRLWKWVSKQFDLSALYPHPLTST